MSETYPRQGLKVACISDYGVSTRIAAGMDRPQTSTRTISPLAEAFILRQTVGIFAIGKLVRRIRQE